MMTTTLLSPLLLALAVGIAAPAHAAADEAKSFPPQACQSVRHELEAMATHLREARLSNAEIARLLGYADSTAFWRAYKAGAGLPPSRDRGGARDPDA